MATPARDELDDGDSVDYFKLSTHGIKLVLNNDWVSARQLFNQHKDSSILMSSGNSFVTFLQALMTFEDDKMEEASRALHETVTRCKTFDSESKSRKHSKNSKDPSLVEDYYLREIVATDCLLYQAGMIIIHQDVSSFIKGGWYIRQAWKSYKKLYHEIRRFQPDDGNFNGLLESSTDPFVDPQGDNDSPFPDLDSPMPNSDSSNAISNSGLQTPDDYVGYDFKSLKSRSSSVNSELSRTAKDRLLGAVCFGYGAFQLFISLCPPKILRLIHFLGFEGNQEEGLKCLDITSQTDTMMAPLATLLLVHYHSVIRPFFALDGSNLAAGIDEANRVLERADQDYPDSALFLYFRSRVCILQAKTDEALVTCRKALAMSENQRETQHICLYEIGRLGMMKLQWLDAAKAFYKLRQESRWARCFYAYLAGLSFGAKGDIEKATQLMKDVPKLVKHKNHQLEMFVQCREMFGVLRVLLEQYCRERLRLNPTDPIEYFDFISSGLLMLEQAVKLTEEGGDYPLTPRVSILLALEMLYIWTTIPNCSPSDLKVMLSVCEEEMNGPLHCLCCLMSGVIQRELENLQAAEKWLLQAMEYHDRQPSHSEMHFAAFACFELGMLKTQEPDGQQEAKRYFLHIKNHYKSYDFDQRLSVKISAALKRIAEEELKSSSSSSGGKNCVIQ